LEGHQFHGGGLVSSSLQKRDRLGHPKREDVCGAQVGSDLWDKEWDVRGLAEDQVTLEHAYRRLQVALAEVENADPETGDDEAVCVINRLRDSDRRLSVGGPLCELAKIG
jgi:hypothetical protein